MMVNMESVTKNPNMKDWAKEYMKREKARQALIDSDPNAQTLYTFEIDVDTLEIEASETKVLDYDEDVTGFATYEESSESNRVYAESLISPNNARQIVLEFCKKFQKCSEKLDSEIKYESWKDDPSRNVKVDNWFGKLK